MALDERLDTWKRTQEIQNVDLMRRLFYEFRNDVMEKCDDMMGDMHKRLQRLEDRCCFLTRYYDMLPSILSRVEEMEWAIGRVVLTQEEFQDNCRLIVTELDSLQRAVETNHPQIQERNGNSTQVPPNPYVPYMFRMF